MLSILFFHIQTGVFDLYSERLCWILGIVPRDTLWDRRMLTVIVLVIVHKYYDRPDSPIPQCIKLFRCVNLSRIKVKQTSDSISSAEYALMGQI